MIDGDINDYIGLDYRDCERRGSPAVVSVDACEHPVIFQTIAESFDVFADRLQRGEEECYIGFRDVDDLNELVSEFRKCIGADGASVPDRDVPTYYFRRHDWKLSETVEVLPNLDFGPEFVGIAASYEARARFFPDFSEVSWMAKCSLSSRKFSRLYKSLNKRLNGCTFLIMHRLRGLDTHFWG